MTDRILYPSLAQPVPETAERNMAKWWRPPSEPQMNQRKKWAVVMAAASGMVLNPYPLPNPTPDLIPSPRVDMVRKVDTRTAPWQRATFFDPLPIPTPPNVAMWEPWTNLPVWPKKGLKAPYHQAEFFVDWQPFFNPATNDVFVKYYPEKDKRKERDQQWEEEEKLRIDRRNSIAEAVFGDSTPILWTGRPATTAVTPQTMGLTQDIFAAKTKIRTLNEIAEEEEMEKQLEQLLLKL
ncbi:MAG: hypothetical protein KF802_16335 [Bdellovibrionaceae bacterium]|nr:hypothetical protein [Pseudobdellovibrionaceae bacterium]